MALGVYRFWRDTGYALGALIGGLVAAFASLEAAVLVAAALTAASGIACQLLMTETHSGGTRAQPGPSGWARL